MQPKFYLAAPFFNSAQLKLVMQIEQVFMEQNVTLISPRLQDENKKPGPLSAEDAAKIYKRNVDGLHAAQYVLAVVDWLLPDNQFVGIIGGDALPSKGTRPIADILAGPLNIPDAGTVYEMGYAAALRLARASEVPEDARDFPWTLLFVPKPRALNLMLTQGVSGFIQGIEHLQKFLNFGNLNFEIVPTEWTGGNV